MVDKTVEHITDAIREKGQMANRNCLLAVCCECVRTHTHTTDRQKMPLRCFCMRARWRCARTHTTTAPMLMTVAVRTASTASCNVDGPVLGRKRGCHTEGSHLITHRSTNWACWCLTAHIGRDGVLSPEARTTIRCSPFHPRSLLKSRRVQEAPRRGGDSTQPPAVKHL
jgi:hypothetical protein